MDQADVETYLRCRAEDALLAENGLSELLQRVRSAIAIGAIEPDVARTVLADFHRASALRTGEPFDDDGARDGDGESDEPGRVIACPTMIEQPWGTMLITHVTLGGSRETDIGVLGWVTSAPAAAPRGRGRHFPGHDWPDSLEIVDDRGRTYDSHFHGGSSGRDFEGGYTVHPALDPATGAIIVLGHRIDLTGTTAPPQVRIESVAGWSPIDRARRHLELVGGERHRPWRGDGVDIAARTIADLGIPGIHAPGSEVDEPGARQRRRVAHSRGSGRQAEQWIVIGAVAGPVDDVTISASVLRRRGDAVTISYGYLGDVSDDPDEQVRPRATDDLGHTYRFDLRGGSGGDGSWSATAALDPPLHRDASTLTIEFHTLTHIVSVDVPLDWQRP